MPVRSATTRSRTTSLSRIGQHREIVIPKPVFEQLKLSAGDVLQVTTERNRVVMLKKQDDLADTLTAAEARKVRRGEAQLRAGKTKPWKQVRRELGL